MTGTALVQVKPRPSQVGFAVVILMVACAIALLRVALKYDWTRPDRVAFVAIVALAFIWLWSRALFKARRWVWWLTVLALSIEAAGAVLDLTLDTELLVHASHRLDKPLFAVQYAFECAVLVLLLHQKSRQWFGIGAARAVTSDVASCSGR
jgi:hypothetical protein